MPSPQVICLGGATLDRKYRGKSAVRSGTSNPVEGSTAYGGVARNVCEALVRLGVPVGLATLVGDDANGNALLSHLAKLDVALDLTAKRQEHRTAEYVAALEPNGSLALGLSDMAIFDAFTSTDLDRMWAKFEESKWVFADCNLPVSILAELIARRQRSGFHLAIDPVSVAKAAKLPPLLAGVDLLVLNRDEAHGILKEELEPDTTLAALRKRGAGQVVLTDGAHGLYTLDETIPSHIPARSASIEDVTGAGDALIAGTLAGLLAGLTLADAAAFGNEIAALTVGSKLTVYDGLSPAMLKSIKRSAS